MTLTVYCAWCKTTMVQGDPDPGPVSHGICKACADEMRADNLQADRAAAEWDATPDDKKPPINTADF